MQPKYRIGAEQGYNNNNGDYASNDADATGWSPVGTLQC